MISIERLYEIYGRFPQVETDTRKVLDGKLFFALKGPSFNGNAFAEKALQAGAAYAVVDDAGVIKDDRYLLTEDVLSTLQQLALHHRKQFKIPFLAITGSNGKTTTKELLSAVLSQKYKVYATVGNLNNHIGIPLTLLKIKMDAELAIIEMGANHKTEIASYCKLVLPTHGLITNCGKAHIEGFGGVEGVKKGKGELYDFIRDNKGTIFINADLDYLQEMAHGISHQYSYGQAHATICGKALQSDFFLNVTMQDALEGTTIHTHLVGTYNLPNILAAVAVGNYFEVSIADIVKAIEAYNPDNSRSQLLQLGTNKIILDAYNANPSSMMAAIDNFAAMQAPHKRLWIGGMKEMGADELNEHKELVNHIARYTWDEVILIGKEFAQIAHNYLWWETSDAALQAIDAKKISGSTILIKGSRGSKMEVLLELFRDSTLG